MTRRRRRTSTPPPQSTAEAFDAFEAWAAVHVLGQAAPPTTAEGVARVEGTGRAGSSSSLPSVSGAPAPGRGEQMAPPPLNGPKSAIARPAEHTRTRPPKLRIRERDLRAFDQLRCTGVASERHLVEGAGLNRHRVRHMVAEGYLEAVDTWAQGRPVRVYTLGRRGVARLRASGAGPRYRRNPQQVGHDLKLTDMYYALAPEVRASWVHEGELIDALKAAGVYDGACVDGAVEVGGQWVAIEAITDRYTQAQIAAKQRVIDRFFDGRGVMA